MHLSIVWGTSLSHFWFLPLTASRSGRSWRDACMKTGATPNSSWTASLRTVIEFMRNSKASCRPTGSPREPTEGGSRRTWTFAAVTSRASRLASPLWSPTSGRAPPKGTSKMTHHTEMPIPRCLRRPGLMTLPLIMPSLQSLALILMRTLPCRLRSTRVLLARLPPVLSLEMMMIFSLATWQREWRRVWPTSPSHPPVDKRWRERKPHMWRHLPLQRKSNCRTDGCSSVASRASDV